VSATKAYAIGLDCGGSTVRARATDLDGRIVFEGKGGPANLTSQPTDVVVSSLRTALEGAPLAETVCACFAGLLTAQDRETAIGYLSDIIPAPNIEARPDFHATVAAAPDCDAIVIAGTGTIIASGLSDGTIVKSGGGGILLGDEGSAMSIGRNAIAAYVLPATRPNAGPHFTRTIHAHFGDSTPNEIIHALYTHPTPASFLASFAPSVVADWANADPFATPILQDTFSKLGKYLSNHLLTHHRELCNPIVGLSGGLWLGHPNLRSLLACNTLTPGLTLKRIDVDPVEGALRLATQSIHHGN